jgi:hypothetical protein
MAELETLPPDRLAFWGLVRRTLSTLKERPLFFFGLAAIAALPANLLRLDYNIDSFQAVWVGQAYLIVDSFLSAGLLSAIAYCVFKKLKGNEAVSPSQVIAHAVRGPLFGFALLLALCFALNSIIILFMGGPNFEGRLGRALAELTYLGLYLKVFSHFLAVIPACVVEELGFQASIQRNLELTRGRQRQIFLTLAGCFCVFFPPAILIGLILMALGNLAFAIVFLDVRLILVTGQIPDIMQPFAGYLLGCTSDILFYAVFAIMCSIIYCDLRDIEEERVLNQAAVPA